jgi:hypothetical protein
MVLTRMCKVKINLSLCLANYALRHEGVWGNGCIHPHFLVSALVLGEWSASRPGRFNPRDPFDRSLGGPQSWSGRRGEEKILDPTGTRTPTPRSSSP